MNGLKVKIVNEPPSIEMLRAQAGKCSCDGCVARRWAADEIERLQASHWRLRSAIEFAHAEGFQWPSDPMAEFAAVQQQAPSMKED